MKTLVLLSGVLITLLCCLSKHSDGQENECVQNGGHCIFMAAAVACYHQLQLSCGSNNYFCCKPNIRSVEEAEPTCQDVGGVCLHIAYQLHCPKKLNATCHVTNFYCCDLHGATH